MTHTVISANVTRFALSRYVNGAKRQLLLPDKYFRKKLGKVSARFKSVLHSKIPKCWYIGIFELSISPIPVSKQILVYTGYIRYIDPLYPFGTYVAVAMELHIRHWDVGLMPHENEALYIVVSRRGCWGIFTCFTAEYDRVMPMNRTWIKFSVSKKFPC